MSPTIKPRSSIVFGLFASSTTFLRLTSVCSNVAKLAVSGTICCILQLIHLLMKNIFTLNYLSKSCKSFIVVTAHSYVIIIATETDTMAKPKFQDTGT